MTNSRLNKRVKKRCRRKSWAPKFGNSLTTCVHCTSDSIEYKDHTFHHFNGIITCHWTWCDKDARKLIKQPKNHKINLTRLSFMQLYQGSCYACTIMDILSQNLTLSTVLFMSIRLSLTSKCPSWMSFWSTMRNTPTSLKLIIKINNNQ